MNKAVLGKTIKIAFAAVAAILVADLLHLEYAVTAGIITILSIQNTKKKLLRLRGTEEWLLPALCSLLSYASIFWDSILPLSHYIYFYLR